AQLLGTRVDPDLLKMAENDAQARSAAKDLIRQIRSEYPIPASDRELGDFDLCETRSQRARAIGKLLVTRTAGDYRFMPLPRPLWPIYYVVRPFRLASKAMKSLTGVISARSRSSKANERVRNLKRYLWASRFDRFG